MADALFAVLGKATDRLFSTTPTSLPGVIALLRYVLEREASEDELLKITNLNGTGRRADLELCSRVLCALEQIESNG